MGAGGWGQKKPMYYYRLNIKGWGVTKMGREAPSTMAIDNLIFN